MRVPSVRVFRLTNSAASLSVATPYDEDAMHARRDLGARADSRGVSQNSPHVRGAFSYTPFQLVGIKVLGKCRNKRRRSQVGTEYSISQKMSPG